MFDRIIQFSVRKKLFVGLTTLFLLLGGLYAMYTLPVDAVPDITNNQVQIVTVSPTLAPQEVERLITFPIEIGMSNIMRVQEIRSVSRFGLSVVTVVFDDNVPVLDARQLVNEQILAVSGEIPTELGTPQLMPISTGLGEIYQYTLDVQPGYEDRFDAMELRTIQDWIVKRQLSGIPGIVEINSFGGLLKQYEVALNPEAMYSLDITVADVFNALSLNNQNTGGSYIERANRAYYIRAEGMVHDVADIAQVVVANRNGTPIRIADVASVKLGAPKRFGAMTMDGKGECVGGIAMMLRGANANQVTEELETRVARVQQMLPEGVKISPYLNRAQLVDRNISTVIRNLVEGAIIVFVVLMLFLGNVRAGFIVASVIPLAMLFGFILMRLFGVSANLMSLGAIDFGIVVDGAIVIAEGVLAHIYGKDMLGKKLTHNQMDVEVIKGSTKVARSATFAVFIILIVFFPLLTLQGIEGKYFTPMAKTLVFCIVGALLLSMTYVPMMMARYLSRDLRPRRTFADRFFDWLNVRYIATLKWSLHHLWTVIFIAFGMLAGSLLLFNRLGAEFIPTLDEGDFAMQMTLPSGSSLTQSIEVSKKAEKALLDRFPEIKHVVAKIGTAEVPTDPMAVEDADVMIVMKPFAEWVSATSRAEMVELMKEALAPITEAEFTFSQPIQLRFNELMTGAKADIAIKLYGEDMEELFARATEAAALIEKVPGASDVMVERAIGLPQLVVNYDRARIAQYGVDIEELNTIIRSAYAGETAGVVFENERRFDLVLRLDNRQQSLDLDRFFVRGANGAQIPMSELASVELIDGPTQINRDATKRRIVIGVNVRDADMQNVVDQISASLDKNIKLKPGYYFEYGGAFENLQNAIRTLLIVVPVSLMLIMLLLFFAFRSIVYSFVVFSTIPLSLIGGIAALWLRGLPFSISAGVGFIALFGVAVLNGILMINRYNSSRMQTHIRGTHVTIMHESSHLLRPVFLTGLVASLGFVPMAIATSAGAEVQRPLATVVIGGLLVSTFLSLVMIPVFYRLVGVLRAGGRRNVILARLFPAVLSLSLLLFLPSISKAQDSLSTPPVSLDTVAFQPTGDPITLDQAISMALEASPRMSWAAENVSFAKAGRATAWDLGPTSVEYARGQLNGRRKDDWDLTVSQGIGSIITPFYRNALANSMVRTSETQRELVRRELVAEVKRAWVEYLFALEQARLFADHNQLAEQLLRIGELRYQQGEISSLERSITLTLAASMKSRLFQANEALRLAASRLRWACYVDRAIIPADTAQSLLQVTLLDTAAGSLQRQLYEQMAETARKGLSVARSQLVPEFTLSYTRRNMMPDDKGLNAFAVGVAIPILFQGQAGRIGQAKAEMKMAQSAARLNEITVRNRLDELNSLLRMHAQTLQFYRSTALPEADNLLRTAKVMLRSSETSMIEYVQSLNAALDIRQGYHTTLYNYNVAALEMEMYQ